MHAVLRLNCTGSVVRRGLAGLAVVGGLLLAGSSHAQEARAATGGSHSPVSLPDGIPFKRDQPADSAGGAGDARWLGMVMAGGLAVLAFVMIARRRVAPAKAAGAWRTGFGSFLGAASSQEVQRVSSMALSPRQSLHVVVWNGRRLLLGCTEHSIQLLAEAPSTDEPSGAALVAAGPVQE